MRTIISSVPTPVIEKQLQHCRLLKTSCRGNFELYVFRHRTESPLLLEIGRLRELSFRHSGSGTGKSLDLDEFDTGTFANQQLIAWDPVAKKIAGGYRLQHCTDAFDGHSNYFLPSGELFQFSEEFRRSYLPVTMELGRSWIQPAYQSRSENPRSVFVLESLWEGIGIVAQSTPHTEFLFGKVTIPRSYPVHARDLILSMLNYYFRKNSGLVQARHNLNISPHMDMFFKGLPLQQGLTELKRTLKFYGLQVPPLVSAYLKLSDEMMVFDTTINTGFGQVPDTAIMHEIAKLKPEKRERYFPGWCADSHVA
ncbi:MAG TPA: GNAT family N-acyltransferase [Bacteroidia bacterium]|nr:GNAT family N-acyltransferase [Bacteroidia bacterium]